MESDMDDEQMESDMDDEEEMESDIDEGDNEDESSVEEKKVAFKKRPVPKSEAEDDDDLNLALEQLKEEEKNETQFNEARVSSEVEKGKSVRIQKKIFD